MILADRRLAATPSHTTGRDPTTGGIGRFKTTLDGAAYRPERISAARVEAAENEEYG